MFFFTCELEGESQTFHALFHTWCFIKAAYFSFASPFELSISWECVCGGGGRSFLGFGRDLFIV